MLRYNRTSKTKLPYNDIHNCIKKYVNDSFLRILVSNQHCTSMSVLDLFTRDGQRLTFLCNTHTLIEGRRKRMKLGFLAQLIE